MSAIINIGQYLPVQPVGPATTAPGRPDARAVTDKDVVEFSSRGEALARAAEESSFRIARARAVRAEIDAGTYETPERLAGTVERLLDIIV